MTRGRPVGVGHRRRLAGRGHRRFILHPGRRLPQGQRDARGEVPRSDGLWPDSASAGTNH